MGYWIPGVNYLALVGMKGTGNQVEQGRFTRPVGADQAGNATLSDFMATVVNNIQCTKRFLHIFDFQDGLQITVLYYFQTKAR